MPRTATNLSDVIEELIKAKDEPRFKEMMSLIIQSVKDGDKVTVSQVRKIINGLTEADESKHGVILVPEVKDVIDAIFPSSEPRVRTTAKGSVCSACEGKGWV